MLSTPSTPVAPELALDRVIAICGAMRTAMLGTDSEQINENLLNLQEAFQTIQALEEGWQNSPPSEPVRAAFRSQLQELRTNLCALGRLAEHGEALHKNWAKLLAMVSGGYTAEGDAAPLELAGSLSIQG